MSTVATAAMTTITPEFIHYFPTRNAITDPYSCFVYLTAEMSVTLGGGELSHFTLSYPKKAPNLTFHNDPFKLRRETYMGTFRFKPDNLMAGEHVRELNVYRWDIDVRDSAGAKIPVLTILNANRLFKVTLKRNLLLYAATGITVSSRNPPPTPTPAISPHIQHVTDASTAVLTAASATIPTPTLKAKKTPATVVSPSSPYGDLRPFVAKQLLEFAQLKKEMCPITAEEYYKGETAVMPCGHLFMRIAIEESFKKEYGKCPSCRQPGRPTYV